MVALQNSVYLVAAVLFILAFKGMSHPRSAVRGNLLGAVGMFLAVLVTLFDRQIVSYTVIAAGLLVGSLAGTILALKVRMTAMPQMVALLNGFGGGASVLVSGAALYDARDAGAVVTTQLTVATVAGGIIGAVTFWGSLVAYAKLEEWRWLPDLRFRGLQALNLVLLVTACVLGGFVVRDPAAIGWYWALVAVSSVLGFTLVMPIGGADMPVVICLLNSYSGLAAAATGFVLSNNALIISGSLVGASGIILT
ncbi:MAG TPA: NAD(P)(+) transhydrogenase (Re/Si-specific) subunit beta, partial [Vicinamibacteria bacterium]|nr:NAD(P)(+) transhydrogenase (Re/Si-specific) subunit beta [Vicinamibacteria bacterium]